MDPPLISEPEGRRHLNQYTTEAHLGPIKLFFGI